MTSEAQKGSADFVFLYMWECSFRVGRSQNNKQHRITPSWTYLSIKSNRNDRHPLISSAWRVRWGIFSSVRQERTLHTMHKNKMNLVIHWVAELHSLFCLSDNNATPPLQHTTTFFLIYVIIKLL